MIEKILSEEYMDALIDIMNLSEEKLDFSKSDNESQELFRTLLIDHGKNTIREMSEKEKKSFFIKYRIVKKDPKKKAATLKRGKIYEKIALAGNLHSAAGILKEFDEMNLTRKRNLEESEFLNNF
jgi:hypothetical protein